MDAIDAINRYKRPAQRRQVSVSLSEHDHKRLTQVADQHEISQQDCLRAAVDYFLSEILEAPAPDKPPAAAQKPSGNTGSKRPAGKKPAARKSGQKPSAQTRRHAATMAELGPDVSDEDPDLEEDELTEGLDDEDGELDDTGSWD